MARKTKKSERYSVLRNAFDSDYLCSIHIHSIKRVVFFGNNKWNSIDGATANIGRLAFFWVLIPFKGLLAGLEKIEDLVHKVIDFAYALSKLSVKEDGTYIEEIPPKFSKRKLLFLNLAAFLAFCFEQSFYAFRICARLIIDPMASYNRAKKIDRYPNARFKFMRALSIIGSVVCWLVLAALCAFLIASIAGAPLGAGLLGAAALAVSGAFTGCGAFGICAFLAVSCAFLAQGAGLAARALVKGGIRITRTILNRIKGSNKNVTLEQMFKEIDGPIQVEKKEKSKEQKTDKPYENKNPLQTTAFIHNLFADTFHFPASVIGTTCHKTYTKTKNNQYEDSEGNKVICFQDLNNCYCFFNDFGGYCVEETLEGLKHRLNITIDENKIPVFDFVVQTFRL